MSPNPQFHADSVKFTEEILNRKLHFLQWQQLALFCETKKQLKSPQVFLQLQLVMAKGETKNTQITTTHQKLDSCSF